MPLLFGLPSYVAALVLTAGMDTTMNALACDDLVVDDAQIEQVESRERAWGGVEADAVDLQAVPADAAASGEPVETWAGHHVALGERWVPFMGKVETRTDTYVLATVRKQPGSVDIKNRVCRVEVKPVGRVRVRMNGRGVPGTTMKFAGGDQGAWRSTSATSWGSEDVDRDGHPGLTVRVEHPLCKGSLYVETKSQTKSRATFRGGEFRGSSDIHVEQGILGADSWCLEVTAEDTVESVQGPFAYRRVADGTDCNAIGNAAWPVNADAAR